MESAIAQILEAVGSSHPGIDERIDIRDVLHVRCPHALYLIDADPEQLIYTIDLSLSHDLADLAPYRLNFEDLRALTAEHSIATLAAEIYRRSSGRDVSADLANAVAGATI